MSRALKVVFGTALLVAVAAAVLSKTLFNPFNFGPCDGHGPENGTWREYHENGKLRLVGTVKDCQWEGTVMRYYESGAIESSCGYMAGTRNGSAVYFTPEGIGWKQETYMAGVLVDFEIQDIEMGVRFIFMDDTLRRVSADGAGVMAFAHPRTMSGNDQPFVSLHGHDLVLRGAQDYYIINADLGIELNLRDSLLKYIPSAYHEKVDFSGNKFSFLWHRNIAADTLRVKVFYDADEHQSNGKTWMSQYPI